MCRIVFEDCSIFDAKIRYVVGGLRRSLLGYYVDYTGTSGKCHDNVHLLPSTDRLAFFVSDDFKPVIIAGGQLGYDQQATRGGGES